MKNKLIEYDLVLLSRYVQGGGDQRSKLRIFSSKILNFFCRVILGGEIKDHTSGIFLMKREALKQGVPISYGHGEFFIEFLYSVIKKGFSIKEIPYKQKIDDADASTSTSPNLLKFFILGFFYFLRVLITRFRRN